ncbi:MAG: hypothetical protein EXS19_05235 [Pedosphaera sp.]|nr:hypothetical protein [Pedosphaera sp.]
MNTPNTQMELSFNNNPQPHRTPRRQTRLDRAQWWFARIRQVLDAVVVTPPESKARPLQERLDLAA